MFQAFFEEVVVLPHRTVSCVRIGLTKFLLWFMRLCRACFKFLCFLCVQGLGEERFLFCCGEFLEFRVGSLRGGVGAGAESGFNFCLLSGTRRNLPC